MCDKCGHETRDIITRSAAYAAVRFVEGIPAIDKIEETVIEGVGLKDEMKSKSKENMQLVAKTAVNAAVDYSYDMWLDPWWKKSFPDAYFQKSFAGLCPCELMKGLWQLLAQVLYEKGINGKVHGGSVIKDAVAIFAQFPIHNMIYK